ncbi:hypothetical protein ACFVYJ_04765 [Pontibacter sp. JAM-7]|uniref:hypothetical protein n=1 Tax=Pontibacter sp. JAM-7 TaxID=3366581 RepID=UPI003AF66AF7
MSRKTLITLALINSLSLTSADLLAAPQTLWRSSADYVAVKNSSSHQLNQHPYPLSAEAIAPILSQLSVSVAENTSLLGSQTGKTQRRVFTDREINMLAKQISAGLTQAQTDESIVFSISDLRPAYFGEKSLSVSGTAFIRDNKLNLLFGEVHVDLQKKYVRSGASVSNSRFASKVELARYRLPTGSEEKAASHDWQLLSFKGATPVAERPDWLQVDLNQTYKYALKKADTPEQLEYVAAAQEAANAALESRIEKLEQIQPPSSETATSNIEIRLRKLKTLYQQGVIPEAIYKQKVQAIVADL